VSLRRTGDQVAIQGSYQFEALLHGPSVQRHWHRRKLALVDRLSPPRPTDRALDIGGGSGVVAAHLSASAGYVLGIDGNPGAVAFARAQFGREGIEFREGLVDRMLLPQGRFQKAFCMEVIEHVHEPQAVEMLRSIARALEPGGTLLLTTPNYASLWPAIELALDLVGAVPRLKDEQHVSRYTHARLRRVCEEAGFETTLERSICTVRPWLALVSERLALRATRSEIDHRIPFGTILAHLCRKL
jgi:2-polyprenyl-3-methyl-5-hydroxy-6-metoxy-1,4-benzoquinol methylase